MQLGRTRGTLRLVPVVLVAALIATSCTQLVTDELIVSSDNFQGRDNGTQGSADAREYLIGRLQPYAVPLDRPEAAAPGAPPVAPFTEPFDGGTNVVAKIPGGDLASEYVIIGAHYDHLGVNCRTADPNDHICNGATDNGAGVAALLSLGDMIAKAHPRRSVVLAFWDREEDGLLGSRYFTQHPMVPLAQTVAYINFDIQGANLLPSLQNTSFAVGAETGGGTLTSAVNAAIDAGPLQTRLVSSIFGQGRSDYVNFTAVGVPNVFFSDSTGPCYHTAQDSVAVVDFWKLDQQVQIAYRLAMSLLQADGRPAFSATNPPATIDDAVSLQAVVHRALGDLARFTADQRQQLLKFRDDLDAIVAAGAANFGDDDISTVVGGAATAVGILASGTCEGFISKH
jgi:Peptidase family M28